VLETATFLQLRWKSHDRQTGSHVVLWRASDGARVVVPWHNRDLGRGLTLRIIKSAGLTRDEFEELL